MNIRNHLAEAGVLPEKVDGSTSGLHVRDTLKSALGVGAVSSTDAALQSAGTSGSLTNTMLFDDQR